MISPDSPEMENRSPGASAAALCGRVTQFCSGGLLKLEQDIKPACALQWKGPPASRVSPARLKDLNLDW